MKSIDLIASTRPAESRMAALGWALAAAFGFFMSLVSSSSNGRFGIAHPGNVIGIVFTVCALAMWLMSFAKRPEQLYATFTGREKDAAQ